MGILAWIVLGLFAGMFTRFLTPGEGPGGTGITMALGVVGALAGGLICTLLGVGDITGLDPRSLSTAVVGAIVLVFGYRLLKQRGHA